MVRGTRLTEGDLEALFDWQAGAPGASHDDYLMPLYAVLGTGGLPARRLNDEVSCAALAMDAYQFGAADRYRGERAFLFRRRKNALVS